MAWMVSLAVSLISGIAGLLLGGLIANACVSWYGISSREGGSGYLVILLAVAGGILGGLVGLLAARGVAGYWGSGLGRELAAALVAVLLLAAVATLGCRVLADVPPRLEGRELVLLVEFRFPAADGTASSPVSEGDWRFELSSLSGSMVRRKMQGVVKAAEARLDSGRWIVPGTVDLFTERGGRVVTLSQSDREGGCGFTLPLPRRPGRRFLDWSDWTPRQQPDGQPWPADRMSCRFRVQPVSLPEPAPVEDPAAIEAARREAEFVAIPADAPVQQFFPYLAWEQPQTARARERITARPNLESELGALAVDADATVAGAALRCIAGLPQPGPGYLRIVETAGRDLVRRMVEGNAITAEQDPSYDWVLAEKGKRVVLIDTDPQCN
ncbi:MAG: hypothetical protein J0L84_18710, partial [Verrucomicrobia bacterium]|nr:hypothetical protein [Verrucomicrobiota bacterium]